MFGSHSARIRFYGLLVANSAQVFWVSSPLSKSSHSYPTPGNRYLELSDDEGVEGDPQFRQKLRKHFLTHSRGSSINVSFDHTYSINSSSGDSFREEICQRPSQLRTYVKEKLRYHFMSPIEKWKYRRVFPLKLLLQIIKIIVVTYQIVSFGMESSQYYKEHGATETALKVYFLNGWDTVRDVFYYPPSFGPYAVYSNNDIFAHMDNVLDQYANVTDEPIGSFFYDSDNHTYVPATLCLTYYEVVNVFPFNSTVKFNNKRIERCLPVDSADPDSYDVLDISSGTNSFSMKQFFKKNNIILDLDRLAHARLEFTLRTMYRRHQTVFDYLASYKLFCTVFYNNEEHDGQIEVNLNVTAAPDYTNYNNETYLYTKEIVSRQFVNSLVFFISLLSFILCVRSCLRCYELHNKTVEFFETQMNTQLGWKDRLEFLDLWLCLIVLNDALIMSGTVFKVLLDLQFLSMEKFKHASVLLGTGILLVWCGVIRYLGYMKSYNVIILTLKKSTPDLMKFLIAALILFVGYALCGWVVLGPHHIKFKTFSTSAECLYAITNGDDIFATFALATDDFAVYPISQLIWWFCRVYLYSFVILFICIVINLLVAVICEAYESIKEISDASRPKHTTFVRAFICERDTTDVDASFDYLVDEKLHGRIGTFEVISKCLPCFQEKSNTDQDLHSETVDPIADTERILSVNS